MKFKYLNKNKAILFIVFAFSLLLLLIPSISYAAETTKEYLKLPDLFSPQYATADNDFIIKTLIGVFNGPEGVRNPYLEAISYIYLYIVLILGGVLIVYNVTMGFVSTASAGKILGEKASLGMSVARLTTGVGFLLPLGGGYAAIQLLIFYLATQGVLAGNMMYEKFLDQFAKEASFSGSVALNKNVRNQYLENLRPLVLANYCRLEMNDIMKETNKDKVSSGWFANQNFIIKPQAEVADYIKQATHKGKNNYLYSSKELNVVDKVYIGNKEYPSICGEFELTTKFNLDELVEANIISKQDYNVLVQGNEDTRSKTGKFDSNNVEKVFNEESVSSIFIHNEIVKQKIETAEKRRELFREHVSSEDVNKNFILKVAETIHKMKGEGDWKGVGSVGDVADSINESADQYMKNITSGIVEFDAGPIKVTIKSNSSLRGEKLANKLKEKGMVTLGAYYWAMVTQENKLSEILSEGWDVKVNNLPNVYASDCKDAKHKASCNSTKYLQKQNINFVYNMTKADEIFKEAMFTINPNYRYFDGTMEANSHSRNSGYAELFEMLTGASSSVLVKQDFAALASDTGNPLITLHTLGQKFIWWIEGFMMKLLDNNSPLKGNMLASGLILPIVFSAFVPAVTLVYYLPALPFIIWIGAIFGWFVMLIQATFGSPLWMVAHLIPEKSDSFIGSQKQGYMLVLALIMRTPLMVLGGVVSIAILVPIGSLINTFYSIVAMSIIGGQSMLYLIGLLAVSIIYVFILQNTVKKIFSMIHVIPDTILEWFGQGANPLLGQYADGIENGSQQGIQSMGGGISGAANSLAYRMGMGGSAGGLSSNKLSMGGALSGSGSAESGTGSNSGGMVSNSLGGSSSMIGGNNALSGSGAGNVGVSGNSGNNQGMSGLASIANALKGSPDWGNEAMNGSNIENALKQQGFLGENGFRGMVGQAIEQRAIQASNLNDNQRNLILDRVNSEAQYVQQGVSRAQTANNQFQQLPKAQRDSITNSEGYKAGNMVGFKGSNGETNYISKDMVEAHNNGYSNDLQNLKMTNKMREFTAKKH